MSDAKLHWFTFNDARMVELDSSSD